MNSYHPNAESIARDYIGAKTPLKVLGWGVDGVVYPSPTDTTAVKIHKGEESFARELAAYKRLRKHDVTVFEGFNVPRLVRFDASRLIIEMSVVKVPFLLDFAGSTLNTPKKYPPHAMQEFWEKVHERFEDDADTAISVFWGLVRQYGIYYWDLKPGNLQFR
jgi:hypothetical protein